MEPSMTDAREEDENFWFPIVKPNGEWDYEQIMRELHDYRTLLHEVPLVYAHVTGSRISKPNTIASAVIGEADENYQRMADEDWRDEHEQVGWWDRESDTFYKTPASWREPIYIPLSDVSDRTEREEEG